MQLAARFDTRELDLITVEGFKGNPYRNRPVPRCD